MGLIESIMNENRQAQKKQRDADSAPQGIEAMLNALKDVAPQQSEEDSDVAPISALVDTPSKEDLLKKELKRAERSLKLASASSASEDESATERKRKYLAQQQKRVTFKDPEEAKSETEQIDTSSKPKGSALKQPKKKVLTYKGMKIQSDNEEEEAKSGSGTTSHDSADDYFNQ